MRQRATMRQVRSWVAWVTAWSVLVCAPAVAQEGRVPVVLVAQGAAEVSGVLGTRFVLNQGGDVVYHGVRVTLDRAASGGGASVVTALDEAIAVGGVSAPLEGIDDLFLLDSGEVLLEVRLDEPHGGPALVRYADGELEAIVYDGVAVAGGGALAMPGHLAFEPTVSADGRVAFVADGGLYVWSREGGVEALVEADAALADGSQLVSVAPRLFATSGELIVDAQVVPEGRSDRFGGVWSVGDGGELERLEPSGEGDPGHARVATGSESGAFCTVRSLQIDRGPLFEVTCGGETLRDTLAAREQTNEPFLLAGEYQFLGSPRTTEEGEYFVGDRVTFEEGEPVEREMGFVLLRRSLVGALTEIVSRGDPAPGLEGATFESIDDVVVSPGGLVAFSGAVIDAEAVERIAIFQLGLDDVVRLVAVDGEALELADGSTATVGQLRLSDTNAPFQATLNDRATLLFHAALDGAPSILATNRSARRRTSDLMLALEAAAESTNDDRYPIFAWMVTEGEPLGDVTLTLTLPEGVEYAEGPPTCEAEPGRVVCDFISTDEPVVMPGQVFQQLFQLRATEVGFFRVEGLVESLADDPDLTNNSETAGFFGIDFGVSIEEPPASGGPWLIHVDHVAGEAGEIALEVLADRAMGPGELRLDDSNRCSGFFDDGELKSIPVRSCDLGLLQPGERATVSVELFGEPSEMLVRLVYDHADPNLANNTAEALVRQKGEEASCTGCDAAGGRGGAPWAALLLGLALVWGRRRV